MRPVRIGCFARHHNVKAVGEGVLRGRPNANIGLNARQDDARDLLFMQEQRKISRKKCTVAAIGEDNFARSDWASKPSKNAASRIANKMMARQLAPFVIVEAGIVLLDGVNDDSPGARAPRRGAGEAERAPPPPPDNSSACLRERRNW